MRTAEDSSTTWENLMESDLTILSVLLKFDEITVPALLHELWEFSEREEENILKRIEILISLGIVQAINVSERRLRIFPQTEMRVRELLDKKLPFAEKVNSY